MKKIILALIILITLIFGVYMIKKNEYVHSEAVFVATDSLTNIAFKIDGKIDKMTKEAGDKIKKGELLASLETKTIKTKLKEIEYKIESQNQTLHGLAIQKNKLLNELDINKNIIYDEINQTKIQIKSLNYQILANQVKLKKLKFDKNKFYKLYNNKKISFDKYNTIKTEYNYLLNMISSQNENLKRLQININSLQKKLQLNQNNYKDIKILDFKIQTLYNQLLALKQMKKELEIKLNDSYLYAPFDGVIAKKFVNNSTVIEKGTFIYSIVDPKNIYIKVLLSEKKLDGIQKGSKAIIKLDAYNKEFEGEVEKIMPVSASTFSLVPRDIASGEFTKLDQRFIVKIKIPYNPKIRIGMSGDVKIYKDNI